MTRSQPKVGDVLQFELPTGQFAYGRVLRDGAVAFYETTTDDPGNPPIGSRDYKFIVGVYTDVVKSPKCPVVGHDPSRDIDDEWPPPSSVRDVLRPGRCRIYERGVMRPATAEECEGLEPVAAWDLNHVIERLLGLRNSPGDVSGALGDSPASAVKAAMSWGGDGDEQWLQLDCEAVPTISAIRTLGHEPNGDFWSSLLEFAHPDLMAGIESDPEAGSVSFSGSAAAVRSVHAVLVSLLADPKEIDRLVAAAKKAGVELDD